MNKFWLVNIEWWFDSFEKTFVTNLSTIRLINSNTWINRLRTQFKVCCQYRRRLQKYLSTAMKLGYGNFPTIFQHLLHWWSNFKWNKPEQKCQTQKELLSNRSGWPFSFSVWYSRSISVVCGDTNNASNLARTLPNIRQYTLRLRSFIQKFRSTWLLDNIIHSTLWSWSWSYRNIKIITKTPAFEFTFIDAIKKISSGSAENKSLL